VGDCIGELMRVFKASFKPFADDLAPFVLHMMDKSRPSTERRVGICIFDDLAENMGDAAASYFPAFLPHILEAVLDPCPRFDSQQRMASASVHSMEGLPSHHMYQTRWRGWGRW
ncbi:hypothetical protein CLOM_g13056, partial [Closterium sp. NIES-68]